ncbi:MAG: carboxypeptidase regulatory-like domain-containing protein [Terriglobia bacterium]
MVIAIGMVVLLRAEVFSHALPTAGKGRVEVRTAAGLPAASSRGVLEGRVLFAGAKIPQATQVENTTDPRDCGRLQSLENVLVLPQNRGIKNVIVSVTDVPLPEDYRVEPSRLVLDNRDCRFQPHVAVLTTGSSVEAVNSDPIFHSVHLYGLRNLNLALAPKSAKVVQPLSRPGSIIVKCDIHGWMQAFIRVDDHPFHAVSAADGSFRIAGIPPGTYTLEAWHEHFGSKEARVKIEAGSVARVTLYYHNP